MNLHMHSHLDQNSLLIAKQINLIQNTSVPITKIVFFFTEK